MHLLLTCITLLPHITTGAYDSPAPPIPISDHEYPRDIVDPVRYQGVGVWKRPPAHIDVGFVPQQTYIQTRHTNTVRRLPQSDAIASATDAEEVANAPRLREVVKHTQIREVYEEEGFDDNAYDHGGFKTTGEHDEAYKIPGYKRWKSLGKPASSSIDSEGQYSDKDEKTADGNRNYRAGRMEFQMEVNRGVEKMMDGGKIVSEGVKFGRKGVEEYPAPAPSGRKEVEFNKVDLEADGKSGRHDFAHEINGVMENSSAQASNRQETVVTEDADDSEEEDESNESSPTKGNYLEAADEERRLEDEERLRDAEIEQHLIDTSAAIAKDFPPPKTGVDHVKFPYYASTRNRNSPLRYALNPSQIPRKTAGGMQFYASKDKHRCEEVVGPSNIIPRRSKDGEWAGKPADKLPRLEGLGDKIDCLKTRYWGDEPLDNPFFSEDSVKTAESSVKREAKEEEGLDDVMAEFYADILGNIKHIESGSFPIKNFEPETKDLYSKYSPQAQKFVPQKEPEPDEEVTTEKPIEKAPVQSKPPPLRHVFTQRLRPGHKHHIILLPPATIHPKFRPSPPDDTQSQYSTPFKPQSTPIKPLPAPIKEDERYMHIEGMLPPPANRHFQYQTLTLLRPTLRNKHHPKRQLNPMRSLLDAEVQPDNMMTADHVVGHVSNLTSQQPIRRKRESPLQDEGDVQPVRRVVKRRKRVRNRGRYREEPTTPQYRQYDVTEVVREDEDFVTTTPTLIDHPQHIGEYSQVRKSPRQRYENRDEKPRSEEENGGEKKRDGGEYIPVKKSFKHRYEHQDVEPSSEDDDGGENKSQVREYSPARTSSRQRYEHQEEEPRGGGETQSNAREYSPVRKSSKHRYVHHDEEPTTEDTDEAGENRNVEEFNPRKSFTQNYEHHDEAPRREEDDVGEKKRRRRVKKRRRPFYKNYEESGEDADETKGAGKWKNEEEVEQVSRDDQKMSKSAVDELRRTHEKTIERLRKEHEDELRAHHSTDADDESDDDDVADAFSVQETRTEETVSHVVDQLPSAAVPVVDVVNATAKNTPEATTASVEHSVDKRRREPRYRLPEKKAGDQEVSHTNNTNISIHEEVRLVDGKLPPPIKLSSEEINAKLATLFKGQKFGSRYNAKKPDVSVNTQRRLRPDDTVKEVVTVNATLDDATVRPRFTPRSRNVTRARPVQVTPRREDSRRTQRTQSSKKITSEDTYHEIVKEVTRNQRRPTSRTTTTPSTSPEIQRTKSRYRFTTSTETPVGVDVTTPSSRGANVRKLSRKSRDKSTVQIESTEVTVEEPSVVQPEVDQAELTTLKTTSLPTTSSTTTSTTKSPRRVFLFNRSKPSSTRKPDVTTKKSNNYQKPRKPEEVISRPETKPVTIRYNIPVKEIIRDQKEVDNKLESITEAARLNYKSSRKIIKEPTTTESVITEKPRVLANFETRRVTNQEIFTTTYKDVNDDDDDDEEEENDDDDDDDDYSYDPENESFAKYYRREPEKEQSKRVEKFQVPKKGWEKEFRNKNLGYIKHANSLTKYGKDKTLVYYVRPETNEGEWVESR